MSPTKTQDVEDDPVIAEYNVYITPRQLEQIYLLQYPNRSRSQAYNDRNGARPTDFRLKPQAGFVEMDIGMNPTANFNKFQSLVWGEAMRKARQQNGGKDATFGAAAGFAAGKTGKGRGGREGTGAANGDMSVEQGLARFQEAVGREQVFAKQTLGGQILQDETGNPNYMLGAFRGDELHLTRVDGIVQMRPQFHHVDAHSHNETLSRRTEPDNSNTTSSSQKPPQALALAQTYKDNRDVENLEALRAKNLLLIAQEEKWTKLEYFDEDEEASYETYHTRLFHSNTKDAAHLKSQMSNESYLDAISAPRVDPSGRKKKRPLTKRQMERIEAAEDDVEGGGDGADGGAEVEVEGGVEV